MTSAEETAAILRRIENGLTKNELRAERSRAEFRRIVRRLREIDPATTADFLSGAPAKPCDATLDVQLFGEYRARYEEVRRTRFERKKNGVERKRKKRDGENDSRTT